MAKPERAGRWLSGAAAAALALGAAPVLAAGECGPQTGTTVTCTSAGNPYAQGITYVSAGDLTVATNADVVANGTVSVTSIAGAAGVASAGRIATAATNTDGIDATGTGAVTVTAASVSTSGTDSAGIIARSTGGTVSVTSTSVTVGAAGGVGILATGPGAVTVTAGATSAVNNAAISATSTRGAVAVTVSGATSAGAAADTAIRTLAGTTSTVTVGSGGSVTGANGLTLNSNTGNTVTNAGTITGTNGYAILVNRGTTQVTNSGTITGRLDLGGPNNNIAGGSLVNSGTFNVTGFSLFGGGGSSITNSGRIQVGADAPTSGLNFLALSRLSNSGTISLANGRADDVLTTSGSYDGSGAASLVLDVPLGQTAGGDSFVVGGAATGSTAVTLVNTSNSATLTAGRTIVQAGAGTSAGAFTLAPASVTSGFVSYAIAYNAGTNAFSLVGIPSGAAYAPLKLVEAARNISYKSTDGWSAHMRSLRDGTAGGGRFWGQAFGAVDVRASTQTTSVFGQTRNQSLSYRQDYYGGVLGFDLIQPGERSGVTAGVLGSFTSSDQNFAASGIRGHFDAASGGAYAAFHAGPLFVNALGKYDHYWLRLSNTPVRIRRLDGESYGATGEVGLRGGGERLYFEPLVTLTWARTNIDDFAGAASSFDFRRGTGLRGKAGGRIGSRVDLGGGSIATIYAGGNAVKEFRGRDRLAFTNGGTTLVFRDGRIPLYGEGFGGVTIGTPGGVTGFLEGYGNYGKVGALRGGGGRVGLRVAL